MVMSRFSGQVVWITGGGSGIGRAIAVEFAKEGALVAVSGRRREKLAETVAEIEAAGGKGMALPCDVTDEASIAEAVRRLVETWGTVDVVVANAGYSVMGRIEDLDPIYWRKQFDTNVFGLVNTVRMGLPELKKRRGRIVLIGSVAGFFAIPKGGVYAASKAAVRMIGQTLSAELRGSGVSCTLVHPSYVESDIVRVDNNGCLHPDRRDPRPKWLIWKAEKAARAIVNASYHRRREVVLSTYGKLAVGLSRISPRILLKLMGQGSGVKPRRMSDAIIRYVKISGEPKRIKMARSPGIVTNYLRALRWISRRHQGVLPRGLKPPLAPIEVSQYGVKIDPGRLALFRNVCECPDNGLEVPPVYPECLCLGLMAEAVLSDAFPFSPFGLIHVGQHITLFHPISPIAILDLSCRLTEIRETNRGFEVDLVLDVKADGREAWKGVTTLLSRNKRARSRRERNPDLKWPATWISEGEPFRSIQIRVPENTGRRYAFASGDWNPHHLYPFTARLLGYRRAIAHGMWTFSRTLSAIEAQHPFIFPVEMNASFKRPILLPSEIELRLLEEPLKESNGRAVRFEVRNIHSGELHMTGSMKGFKALAE